MKISKNDIYNKSNNIYYLTDTFTTETPSADTEQSCWIFGAEPNVTMSDLNTFFSTHKAIHILQGAFKDCSKLTGLLKIPGSVTLIETGAFEACVGITGLEFCAQPELQCGCFKGCNNITTIVDLVFNKTNAFLGYIFGATTSSQNINYVPVKLQTIHLKSSLFPDCFSGCSYITEVSWPKATIIVDKDEQNVTYIPAGAFYECTRLEKAYCLDATQVQIFNSELEAKQLKYDNGTYSYKDSSATGLPSIRVAGRAKGLLDLEHITYVGDYAFYGCLGLNTLYIDEKDTITFGVECFNHCFNLVRIYNRTLSTSTPRYIQIGGTDYGCTGKYALSIIDNYPADFNKQNAVEELGDVFTVGTETYLLNLPHNSISAKVLDLRKVAANKYCSVETSINHINAGFGQYLTDIDAVYLPIDLKSIGEKAFYCSAIKEIRNHSDKLTSIGKNAFAGCYNLTTIYSRQETGAWHWSQIKFDWPQRIYERVNSFIFSIYDTDDEQLSDDAEKQKIISLDSSIEGATPVWTVYPIEEKDRSPYVGLLTNAQFFNSIVFAGTRPVEIPARTFYQCMQLVDFSCPETVKTIGVDAFAGCTKLNYSIPEKDWIKNNSAKFKPASEKNRDTWGGTKRLGKWVFGPERDDSDANSDDLFSGYNTCVIDMSSAACFYTDAFKNISTINKVVLIGPDKTTCIRNWFKSKFNTVYSNPLYTEVLEEDPVTGIKHRQTRPLYYSDGISLTAITDIDFSKIVGIDTIDSFVGSGLILNSFNFAKGPSDLSKLHLQVAEDAFTGSKITNVTCLPSMVKAFNNPALKTITIQALSYFPQDYSKAYQDLDIAYAALQDCATLTMINFQHEVVKETPKDPTTADTYIAHYNDFYTGIQNIGVDAFKGCTDIKTVTFDGIFSINNTVPNPIPSWCNINFKNQYSNPMCYNGVTTNTNLIMRYLSAGSDFNPNNIQMKKEVVSNLSRIYFNDIAIKPFICLNFNLLNAFVAQADVVNISPQAFTGCNRLINVYNNRSYNSKYFMIRKWRPINKSVTVAGSYIIRRSDGALVYGTGGDYTINNKGSSIIKNNAIIGEQTLDVPFTVPTMIAESAFYGCTGLKTLVVPDSVAEIGFGAFSGCTNLTSLTVPFIGKSAQYNEEYGHVGYIFGAPQISAMPNLITNNLLPSSLALTVKSNNINIMPNAFFGCQDWLTDLYINGTIQKLVGDPLNYIADTACYTDSTGIQAILNAPANAGGKPVILYKFTGSTNALGLPSVQCIYKNAFKNNTSLSRISNLPALKIIGDQAFSGCSNLTSIDFASNNQALIIGDLAFKNTKLNTVVFNNLYSVGYRIFEDCYDLRTLSIPNTLTEANTNAQAFAGSSDREDRTVITANGIHHLTMPAYLSSYFGPDGKDRLRSVKLTAGDAIKPGAFSGCAWLRRVDIETTIKEIGSQAFMNCISLNQFNWNTESLDNCSFIGAQAFKDCWNLYTMQLPTTVSDSPDADKITGYSRFIKHPIKTPLEVQSFPLVLTDEDIDEDVSSIGSSGKLKDAHLFISNANQTLRFLSNNFCVQIYEIKTDRNGTRYVSYQGHTTHTFKNTHKYLLNFNPYGSFASSTPRSIDLIIQRQTAGGTWDNLLMSTSSITKSSGELNFDAQSLLVEVERDNYKLADLSFDPVVVWERDHITGEFKYSGYFGGLEVIGYTVGMNLGKYVFANCDKLTNLEGADKFFKNFAGNEAAKAAEIGISIEQLTNNTFEQQGNFVTYTNTAGKIVLVAYISPADLSGTRSEITIPSDINIISQHTFANRDDLTKVTLPDQLTYIEDRAFYSCDNLSKTVLINQIKALGLDESQVAAQNAFERCAQ